MKFILMLLLIASCGKKSIQENAYQYDQTTLSQDADADGVQDWDEIHSGNDPFIANVQEVFPQIDNQITLVQNDGQEVVIKPQIRRVLRDLLLQKTLNQYKELVLPNISQLELRFHNRPAYWRTKLAGKHFTKISNLSGQSVKLDEGFINEPSVKLNALLSSGILDDLTANTYRFIVSTSEGEMIFRVSPKLSIRDFMAQQKILPTTHPLEEISRESYGWRLVNLNRDFSNIPIAGKTYAIVYGTSSEFREKELQTSKYNLTSGVPQTFEYSHEFNVTVFMTHGQLAITKEKVKQIELSPNPDMSARCYYTTRSLIKRENQMLEGIESVNSMINWDDAQIIKLDWFEQGTNGVAFNLNVQILDREWSPEFKTDLLTSKIETGIIQSGCGRSVPVKKQLIPRITGLDAYLLIDASL